MTAELDHSISHTNGIQLDGSESYYHAGTALHATFVIH